MFSKILSIGLFGLDGFMVEVEADISNSFPKFDVVGLPDTSVNESRDRVRSAIHNLGLDFPVGRITINLAPADVRKEGPLYDLPILISLLKATRQIDANLDGMAFVGELSLSGLVRPVHGILPMIIRAKEAGIREIFIPADNAAEGAVVEDISVYPVESMGSLLEHLTGKAPINPVHKGNFPEKAPGSMPDFADVRGQYEAKRALEVAAVGGHNVMLIGPPGSGKSMLAKRIPSILPEMTFSESIETTKLHSIAGTLPAGVSLVKSRPFRAPHHTVSSAGLSGGGSVPHPGEISLAHNGVLFLDELPEFSRAAMEVLRQPVEDGQVTISRVAGRLTYPCSIMLICAMNPCPCGYYGHPTRSCTCPRGAAARYLSRVSGPLLDRLDIHIEVPPVEFEQLSSDRRAESSEAIRKRVNEARVFSLARLEGSEVSCNAKMTPALVQAYCKLTEKAQTLLKNAFERLGFSARAYDRVVKLSRTIADLDRCEQIDCDHVAEAIQYRSLDRKYWQREG